MLWKNELTEIRNENAEQIREMSETMWDQLSPMVEYISSFSIPMFEEEVIKKDLIGMAEEAEIEEISLEEKLGMPRKEFCDNLVKEEMRNERIAENIMEFAVHFVWNLTFFWAIELFLFGNPDKVYVADAAVSLVMAFLGVWNLGGRMAWNKWKEWIKCLLFIGFIVMLLAMNVRTDQAITGNGFVIGGCMILASVMAVLIRRNYWKKQSQKYDWK